MTFQPASVSERQVRQWTWSEGRCVITVVHQHGRQRRMLRRRLRLCVLPRDQRGVLRVQRRAEAGLAAHGVPPHAAAAAEFAAPALAPGLLLLSAVICSAVRAVVCFQPVVVAEVPPAARKQWRRVCAS